MKLKMSEKHQMRLSELLQEIGSTKLDAYAETIRDGQAPRMDENTDKTMRYCFDVFSVLIRGRSGLLDDLYKYLNDDHIYSYLKRRLAVHLEIVNS